MKELSNYLSQTFRIKSVFIAYGLEKPEAADYVFHRVQELGLKIDVLVNNAGVNEFGNFIKTSREKEHDMMYLHMFFVTDMMKLFLPLMLDNKQGQILNIGSTGSYISCPYDAVYAATKSYILSVSKGINAELKGTGVTITTLCPGSTKTEFAAKAGMGDTLLFKLFVMSPERVADIAYKALMKRKTAVVAGIYNKILVMSSYILPNRFVDYLSKITTDERTESGVSGKKLRKRFCVSVALMKRPLSKSAQTTGQILIPTGGFTDGRATLGNTLRKWRVGRNRQR